MRVSIILLFITRQLGIPDIFDIYHKYFTNPGKYNLIICDSYDVAIINIIP